MTCIRCGYCCSTGPCHFSAVRNLWDKKDGRCRSLVSINGEFSCLEVDDPEVRRYLAIGQGCCEQGSERRDEWMKKSSTSQTVHTG